MCMYQGNVAGFVKMKFLMLIICCSIVKKNIYLYHELLY